MLRLLAVLLPVESLVMVGGWLLVMTLALVYFSDPRTTLPEAVQHQVETEFRQAVQSFPPTPNGERVLVLPFTNDHTGQATALFRAQLLGADKAAVIQPGLLTDAGARFGFRSHAPRTLPEAREAARDADAEWAVWGKVMSLPGGDAVPRLELIGFDTRDERIFWGYRSKPEKGMAAKPDNNGSWDGVFPALLGQFLFTLAFLPIGRRIVQQQSNLANALLIGLHGVIGFALAIAGARIAGHAEVTWVFPTLLVLAGMGVAAWIYDRVADAAR